MYGHPDLLTDHARALAPSPRAFNRWFWKTASQGCFPELLLPSPASRLAGNQAGGLLQVAVLFARQDSIYKSIPGCDVFDLDRDARTYAGNLPVVAHPPCRAWGRLRHLAKPRFDEKDLAFFAIEQVRRCGGVLEHPEASSLWKAAGLPKPRSGPDSFGGWTLGIRQSDFGHRAPKDTWLYIVGIEPGQLPPIPIELGDPPRLITNRKGIRSGQIGYKPEVTRREREATPDALAFWLLDLANRCRKSDTSTDLPVVSVPVAVSSTTATKSHG